MAMQSSTGLAFRALIMLSCMILVPVVAVFGTSWLNFWNKKGAQATASTPPAAPPHGAMPLGPSNAGRLAATPMSAPEPRPLSSEPPAARGSDTSATAVSGSPWSAGPPPLAMPATSNATPRFETATIPPPGASPPITGVRARENWPVVQASGQSEPSTFQSRNGRVLQASAPASAMPAAVSSLAAPPAASTDWFRWTQQRLRELGATYYLLETIGPKGDQYRFHCTMAIGGDPQYTRTFEATDTDPTAAMRAVLDKVEAWRAGQ